MAFFTPICTPVVTFEGVGRMVDPDLDVVAVSQAQVGRIFRDQFRLARLRRELVRNGPEWLDLAGQLPELVPRLAKMLVEQSKQPRPPVDTLAGLRGAIFAAACILGGVVLLAQTEAWLLGGGLLLAGWWGYRRSA